MHIIVHSNVGITLTPKSHSVAYSYYHFQPLGSVQKWQFIVMVRKPDTFCTSLRSRSKLIARIVLLICCHKLLYNLIMLLSAEPFLPKEWFLITVIFFFHKLLYNLMMLLSVEPFVPKEWFLIKVIFLFYFVLFLAFFFSFFFEI